MREMAFVSIDEHVTQADFSAWLERRAPTDVHHYELLNGRIVMNPPAGWPHGSVDCNLQMLLGSWVDLHELGKVFGSSQGFELPSGDTIEPDASFVSNLRWKKAPRPRPGQFLRVVPDLIAEVVSPGNAATDRVEKKKIYERNGVREYWLVESRSRELVVFTLKGRRYDAGRTFGARAQFESSAVAALMVDVARLFKGID